MVSTCVVLICVSLITDNGKQSFMIINCVFSEKCLCMYFANFFSVGLYFSYFWSLYFFQTNLFWLDMLQITSIGLKLTFSLAFCYLLFDRSYVDLNADITLITKALNKTWYLLTWFLSGIFWLFMALYSSINFRINLSSSSNNLFGFWVGLHWIYGSIGGKTVIFIILSFLCVDIVYFSVYI